MQAGVPTRRRARGEAAVTENLKERIDRELIELLTEVRVVLPGAQVLFAFLLALPFTGAFEALSRAERIVFFVAFLSTAAATALLMAPSAYHRLRFRSDDKRRMVFTASRLILAGSLLLALAMVTAVYLVTVVLFDSTVAGVAAAVIGAWFVWFWYGLALYHHIRHGGPHPDRPGAPSRSSERGSQDGTPMKKPPNGGGPRTTE